MKSILSTRLSPPSTSSTSSPPSKSYATFDDNAVEFAARKTVGLSGDVRRAFQICKVALKSVIARVTVAIERGEEGDVGDVGRVKVRDVVNAVKIMSDAPAMKAIRQFTPMEALVVGR